MRALSVRQPWAELIARGKKKIEYRTWSVDMRGDLLIVASKGRNDEAVIDEGLNPDDLAYGSAVCVVNLVKVDGEEGDYRWHLRDPRRVEPLPVKGYASIYTVADELLRFSDGTPVATSTRSPTTTSPRQRRRATEDEQPPAVVLVADYLPERRARFVQAVVNELNVAPAIARDGREALSETRRLRPDLLVMAARMPKRSGLEVLLELQRDSSGPQPRVVLFEDTSLPDEFDTVPHKFLKDDVSSSAVRKVIRSEWTKARRGE